MPSSSELAEPLITTALIMRINHPAIECAMAGSMAAFWWAQQSHATAVAPQYALAGASHVDASSLQQTE